MGRAFEEVLPILLAYLKSSRPSLPLRKAPPLISVFSPQGRRGKPPSGARNRYAIRLADHQRSAPCFCGLGPPGLGSWRFALVDSICESVPLYCFFSQYAYLSPERVSQWLTLRWYRFADTINFLPLRLREKGIL